MKDMKKGAYMSKKKDGTVYYRSNISYKGRHISLGSYSCEDDASSAYFAAKNIYADSDITLLNLSENHAPLDYDKAISIINHRDNGIYIKTPIYLRKGYFSYFLKGIGELKFDNDDLFYYSSHRILVHDGHLYVNDFGMQYGILARFGIKNYAVAGRDYTFANGDDRDFRYQNVIVINKYHGVYKKESDGFDSHHVKIHINGDFFIGEYENDAIAAVAYNKAADAAHDAGIKKNFPQNYVVEFSPEEYANVYRSITLPRKYLLYLETIQTPCREE